MKIQLYIFTFLLVIIEITSARSLTQGGDRLIKINHEPASWYDEDAIKSLIREHANFMDITDRVFPSVNHDIPTHAIPTTIRFETTVREALTSINTIRMKAFLTHFSSYHNRYYQSETGVASSEWLLSQVNSSLVDSGYLGNASVKTWTHSWAQKSIVARLEGTDPILKSQVVILGAHLDSINSTDNENGLAQGADDNGSGSVVLLETWRILLEAGFIPKRSVEFHWYAAEEVGLRGSLDIAETYYNQSVNVTSMVNFDVVGYYVEGREEVALYQDYTSERLTEFIQLVVEAYLNFTWFYRECGSRCSDHVSWHEFGFPSVFNKEAVSNPYMHTTNDSIVLVNFRQVAEFVKLSVGYCIEVGEPSV